MNTTTGPQCRTYFDTGHACPGCEQCAPAVQAQPVAGDELSFDEALVKKITDAYAARFPMPAGYTAGEVIGEVVHLIDRCSAVPPAAPELWVDTRSVHLDHTVMMGRGYDWEGWECSRLEMHTPQASFAIWPHQLGGSQRWSLYCNLGGRMIFERFANAGEAKAEAEMMAESLAARAAVVASATAQCEQDVNTLLQLLDETRAELARALAATQPAAASESVQADHLRKALRAVRNALQFANDTPGGAIIDTLWMMDQPQTVFDFIDEALHESRAAAASLTASAAVPAQNLRHSEAYVADLEDSLKQIAAALGVTGGADALLARVKQVAASAAQPGAEQMATIREAIEAAFEDRAGWRTKIAAAVRALAASAAPVAAVPEGWQLVPIEMTGEMERAAEDVADIGMEHDSDLGSRGWLNNPSEVHAAILAAAPAAPTTGEG